MYSLTLLWSLAFESTGFCQSLCPNLQASINYAVNPKLPNPYLTINGAKITSKSQWACRKEEIKQLYYRYSLCSMPARPTASLSGSTLQITAKDGAKSPSFSVTIKLPSSGTAPYPTIIAYGAPSISIPNTVAVITYQNFDIAADNGRGQGKLYDLYGSSASAGDMIAWAWGVSRIIDALELTPAAHIDATRVGVTGVPGTGREQ